jgi:hypothetical protein
MDFPWFLVDAFATAPFTGNPAAVVVLDQWPADDVLAAMAAEHCFGGKELMREAYRVAVEERYRFYSFGDAMLLIGGGRNL